MTLSVPTASAATAVESGFLERLQSLRQTLAPTLTDPELELFGLVAQRKGLDPFSGQIRAIKRNTQRGPVVTYQTGIDGYRSIAERTGQYLGSLDAEFGEDCPCRQQPEHHPLFARVVVRRWHEPSSTVMEQPGRADWHEFVPAEDFMWREKPHLMIAKCAEAQGLRKAFPWVLADIYIPEELAREEQASQPAQLRGRDIVAAKATELRAEDLSNGRPPSTDDQTSPVDDYKAMTQPEFLRAIVAAGISKTAIRDVGGELFPGRVLNELSDEERARLYIELSTR